MPRFEPIISQSLLNFGMLKYLDYILTRLAQTNELDEKIRFF